MKITVCGSIAFYAEMEEVQEKLHALEHEVKIPLLTKEAPAAFGGSKKVYLGAFIEKTAALTCFQVITKSGI